MRFLLQFFFIGLWIGFGSCAPRKSESESKEDLIPYTIMRAFPHDKTAFTQGLTIADGRLFESTGQSNSWIAEVDIATGVQEKKVTLDKKYFGEGITILNSKIYQLTWQSHVGFVYSMKTFEKIGEFQYDYEGWGITHDGKNLIVSDGTDKLRFLDTVTMKIVRELKVMDGESIANKLNELEFIEGYVYANQWQTNYILKIDLATGVVAGRMDLSPLAEKILLLNPAADVLNGIAYEKKSGLLLVTGKLWSSLFALRLQKTTPGN